MAERRRGGEAERQRSREVEKLEKERRRQEKTREEKRGGPLRYAGPHNFFCAVDVV